MGYQLPKTNDFNQDQPVRDGDFDATLVKIYVKDAEKTTEIEHGLGRIPIKVSIVNSDNPIIFQVDSLDVSRAVLTFFENETNITLRFE